MEIDAESVQTSEHILHIGDENVKEGERSELFMIEWSGEGEDDLPQDDVSTAKNLHTLMCLLL